MKLILLILTAIFAAVTSNPVVDEKEWPWQVGKVYRYNVSSHTVTSFEQGGNGHGLKTQFIISVKAHGRLLVKLENSQYAPVKSLVSLLNTWELPSDLKYELFEDLNQTFELFVSNGRVVSIKFRSSLSITLENVLKGLIGALQVDLSNHGYIHTYPNSFDRRAFQGVFKKIETDVTGSCETLYSVSPISSEWRREIPNYSFDEDPFEIVKGRNYGNCHERVGSTSGVPDGAMWAGLASGNEERQLIAHNSETRLLVGKKGTIYKSQVMGFVHASPLIYGKQKAKVYTNTKFLLNSVTKDNTTWQMSQNFRSVNSLLYTEDPSTSFYTPGDQQNVEKAKELLQEISPLLQDANVMPKGFFLIKFNLLVYILASFNAEQLSNFTNSFYEDQTSQNAVKNNMWFVYRDAVVLTGTPEAFEQIKSWILSKKVEGEAAAELMTTIGVSISKPSKTLLKEFFDFATRKEVTEVKYLNNSALLASTKLLRLAEDDKFTVETVIPYLSKQLKQAVETGDSKSVVYVTVLGNLDHPAVLNVFAPYFEGQMPVSKFLRIQMVTNLKNLANRKDAYVRSVLYSIIRNTGEPYEVRVAAALNIFLAFPTFDMMRVLAYMAKNDPSTQVRAVLKNGITFAAGLKDPRFIVLAKSAQAVLDLVPKDQFGYQYSTESLHDGYSSDDEFGFFGELSSIGSDDFDLPKYHRSALRFMGTGLSEKNQVTLSISSFQDLLQFSFLELDDPEPNNTWLKFNVQKIMKSLNVEEETRDPVEISLFLEILNQQRFFNSRQDEFNYKNRMTDFYLQLTGDGVNFKYTKLLYNQKISVAFPLVSGMPFAFEYREPVACQANLNVFINGAYLQNFNFAVNITFARNIDGTVGYMDTLGKTFAAAGVINQFQIHLPHKLKYHGHGNKFVFESLHPGKDENIVHFSVLPYTGIQKQNFVNYDVEIIKRSVRTLSTDVKFGYWTGVMFQLQAFSFSTDYKKIEDLLKKDFMTAVGNLLYQKDVAYTEIDFTYLGSETKVKTAIFAIYNSPICHKNITKIYDFGEQPISRVRCEEVAKKISSGINSALSDIVDISAEFNGSKRIEYMFTAGYAYSQVESKFQAGIFVQGNNQLSAVLKYDMSKAQVVSLNFEEALKNEIKVSYEVDFNYQKTNIHLQGYGIRSKEYTELLKTDPMAMRCLEDMSKENYYQLDCHKMIMKAHAPDYFNATVTYNNFDPAILSFDYVFKALKEVYSWDVEINPFQTIVGDELEIQAQVFYYENFINYKLMNKYGQLKLHNVKGLWYYPYGIAVSDPITALERAVLGYQHLPYCGVDGSKVRTFSGRSYDYTLTSSWHVIMVHSDNIPGQNLVILARRPSANQTEVYISSVGGRGIFSELDIKPGNISIKNNIESRVFNPEYYTLTDGTQVIQIKMVFDILRILYDKHRLVIFTSDRRTTTKGICGQNSGEVQDDYMTPWGLVDRPDHYGASFSLDEDSDPQTLALKTEAKAKAYQPVTKFTKIPRFDAE